MSNVREEVLNVALADLLDKRGLLSIPETIVKATSGGRKLPDVTVADLFGVRMTIEGRFDGGQTVREKLCADAKARVEDGISPICLAVLYPPKLRSTTGFATLRRAIEKSPLRVRVFSETSEGDWRDAGVDGIAEILRSGYELLVTEDVVKNSVEELRSSIDAASAVVLAAPAAPARLRKLLGIPEGTDSDSEADEDEED